MKELTTQEDAQHAINDNYLGCFDSGPLTRCRTRQGNIPVDWTMGYPDPKDEDTILFNLIWLS